MPVTGISKVCTSEDAWDVMGKVLPLISQMSNWSQLTVGFCDADDINSPCCIDLSFKSEEALCHINAVFSNGLILHDLDVRFSYGNISRIAPFAVTIK